MKLHPRHILVEKARRELATFLSDWDQRNNLTGIERLALLSEEINRDLWQYVKEDRQKSGKKA